MFRNIFRYLNHLLFRLLLNYIIKLYGSKRRKKCSNHASHARVTARSEDRMVVTWSHGQPRYNVCPMQSCN